MLNKSLFNLLFGLAFVFGGLQFASAEEEAFVEDVEIVEDNPIYDSEMEQKSAEAVAGYDVSGSMFQQITDLEQEKVLMQLEKEKAQLDLELDRLAAEKIKLHMEIETLSGRAEQAQQELENAKAKLEAETAKLEREKEALENGTEQVTTVKASVKKANDDDTNVFDFGANYKLINVVGAGDELQATIADLTTGQNKRIGVGKNLEGYTVKSISLDEGVVFVNDDGDVQNLNITNVK